MRKVIVNSTPIISLSIIGKLNLLDKLYDTIIIPNAVYNEVVKAGKSKVGAKNLQNALQGVFLCKNKF
jgi:predicted nucleic acid-binding protein